MKRRLPLHTWIFIGLILGAVTGALAQAIVPKDVLKGFVDLVAKPLGDVFLALLFMIVVPLLFSALVLGVGELGEARRIGRVGFLSLIMTVVLSATAVGIGIGVVNLVRPGERIPLAQQTKLKAEFLDEKQAEKSLEATKKEPEDPPVLGFIPRNPLKEATRAFEGGLLPFMFFALVFGLALSAVEDETARPLRRLMESLFAVSQKVIEGAMRLAPFAVFFLIFRTTATLGVELLQAIALYVVLVLAALALHQFGTYSLVLKLLAKRSPAEFFRQMRTTMLTAFSTSSSNATLPTALKAAQDEVGIRKDVASFVLTVGATANQNGTALFEGITVLFLAQLFGKDLSLLQQLNVMGLAIVSGIGTAGIPGGAWPFIATVLAGIGVPPAAIGIVFGIDRILDMSRTVLNVTGDMTIAACVDKLAGGPAPIFEEAYS